MPIRRYGAGATPERADTIGSTESSPLASVAVDWLWTWEGRCFGYRDGDDLWTYNGRDVGRFDGDDVYGPDGGYLGEIRNGNRLITNRSKRNYRRSGFSPYANRAAYARYADYAGYAMYAGYEDFPELEK